MANDAPEPDRPEKPRLEEIVMRFVVTTLLTLWVCALFLLCPHQPLAAAGQLTVVADEATYKESADWVDRLRENGVVVKHARASEPAGYKGERYIFVIGGINEPEGLGELIRQLLKPDDVKWLGEQGNRKMYIRPEAWSPGQTVCVFAGSDRKAALSAVKENQKAWWTQVTSWFDLQVDSTAVRGY